MHRIEVGENRPDAEIVAEAARALELAPRSARWGHLSLCIIDATFSINAGYTGTTNAVRRYATFANLPSQLLTGEDLDKTVSPREDEQTLSKFLESIDHLPDDDLTAREVYGNLQRTSPRGGIRKSTAVRKIAKIFVTPAHRIETLADVSALMADPHRLSMVEADLAAVEGHGQGLRLGYIWMTAGDDNNVKPDRHVLRWLGKALGRTVLVSEARELLVEAAGILLVTPWVLDHAIWKHMAQKGRRRPRRELQSKIATRD